MLKVDEYKSHGDLIYAAANPRHQHSAVSRLEQLLILISKQGLLSLLPAIDHFWLHQLRTRFLEESYRPLTKIS